LIELLVSLTVLAILLGVAVPSFRHMLSVNRITGRANDLIGDLRLARSEAIRRGQPVTLLSRNADDFLAQGWSVMPDEDGDGAAASPATATDGVALRVFDATSGSIRLRRVTASGTTLNVDTTSTDRAYLVFTAQGLNKLGANVLYRVCDAANPSVEGRLIAVNGVGKVSLESTHASCA